MTPAAINAEIRSLTRQLRALRRKLRGPRAKAAARARDERRRERVKAICDAWLDIKRAVNNRSALVCEVPGCLKMGWAQDHFWGGHGRRRVLQSVESVWLLCYEHNSERTDNKPSRVWWVDAFHEHVLAHGLRSQLPFIAAERARIEGKGRTT